MTITLHILSPEGTLALEEVSQVSLPGMVSPFTVLPGHAAMVTALVQGEISYRKADGSKTVVRIREGFAEVRDNKVIACVEEC